MCDICTKRLAGDITEDKLVDSFLDLAIDEMEIRPGETAVLDHIRDEIANIWAKEDAADEEI